MARLYSFMVVGLLVPCLQLSAQGREVPVEVMVDKVGYSHIRGFLERTTEAVYKFYRNEIAPQNYIADRGCLFVSSKDADKTLLLADDPQLSLNRFMRPYPLSIEDGTISIRMEAFRHERGDPCTYDKGDRHYSTAGVDVKMAELDPGVFSSPYRLAGKDGKLWAEIRMRYGLPMPAPISHKDHLAINDVSKVVEFSSFVQLPNKKNLEYLWEFQLEGSNEWKLLGKTISESVVFFPLRDVLKAPIKNTQLIRFRMKAISKEAAGEYVYYETKFTPEAPEFTNASTALTPSCSGTPTGIINMGEVKGVADQFAYYVIKGKTLPEEEKPDLVGQEQKIKWGTIHNGAALKIEGLATGDYTLVVHNAGMKVGNTFITQTFSITQYPALTIKSSEVKEATCSNTPDGQILMETEGGNPSRFTYLISPATGKQQSSGRTVIFSDLLPGIYAVVIKDACNQLASRDIEVTRKTAQLQGQVAVKTEAINEFANGALNVSLENGSGKYRYSVWSNNVMMAEKETSSPKFIIDRLAKGTYQLKVQDLNTGKCPGWDTVFTMTAKVIASDTASSIKDTTNKNEQQQWSSMVTTAKVSVPDVRQSVFAGDAQAKQINSFAAYVKNTPGQKRYYIVIEKSKYEMRVYNAFDNSLIVTYPVVFGSNELTEDKMTEGDRHTPEGEFRIIDKKAHDKWRKFLTLDFPNEASLEKFNQRKSNGEIPKDAKIGGEIGIHGTQATEGTAIDRMENWTYGCVSTKNEYVDELYQYIPVGTKVLIKK